MSPPERRNPRSYDEIIRRTVPDPDSSFRPTERQEHQAREGFRAMDADEQALHAQIYEALVDAQVDIVGIDLELDRSTVTLHGHAPDVASLDRIESVTSRVPGVMDVRNRLVVRP